MRFVIPVSRLLPAVIAMLSGTGFALAAPPAIPAKPCTLLWVTPAANSSEVFTNSQISLAYTADQPGRCNDLQLRDSSQRTVATTAVQRVEWQAPQGVAGLITLEPVTDLTPGGAYQVNWQGANTAGFTVNAEGKRRGELLQVDDQPAALAGLPGTPQVPVNTINQLADTYISLTLKTLGAVRNGVVPLSLYNLAKMDAPALFAPRARYNARIKRITYASSGAGGQPVVLSGLLIYPENVNGSAFDYASAGLVLGQHGWNKAVFPAMSSQLAPDSMLHLLTPGSLTYQQHYREGLLGEPDPAKAVWPAVSSAATPELLVGLWAAGKGQVFFAPDLIGAGASANLPPAAFLAQQTAAASEDMLLAVQEFFAQQFPTTPLGRQLRIVGASQGGYSALAALPALSRLADVQAVYAGQGMYNLERQFAPPLNEAKALGAEPLRSLVASAAAYQGYKGDAEFKPALRRHLGLNNLVNNQQVYSAPAARVVLFHHSKDTFVPARNTVAMLAYLNNGTHHLADASRGNCKESSLYSTQILRLSRSLLQTHLICELHLLNRFVADLGQASR